jgi:signal transduction histidine kinase
MESVMPLAAGSELADALFQALITAGLAIFALVLWWRVRARWFVWWAAAWALYFLRLVAIICFLASGDLAWLFWHQVVTGWVALAILWAALVFSRDLVWRNWYASLGLIPVGWAWVAVNGLDQFLLVALPMVLLISGVTLYTGWVFWQHAVRNNSSGARFVAVVFWLWGLHHLDYPFLRAKGAWQPWGYYLDVFFELAVGIGFGLMVLSELATRLATRTDELARLQGRVVGQYEGERRRLSRELHDETAQTLSAVKLEVGMLREGADPATSARLDHVLGLVDSGIRGIRRVINDLRPALLDDLGLVPAIRSLANDVAERSRLQISTKLDDALPRIGPEAELALFRAAQEALANVVRHAEATHVTLTLTGIGRNLRLTVADDGRGFAPGSDIAAFEQNGHLGLAGMRERITALGGSVQVSGVSGVTVVVEVPVNSHQ